MSKTIFFTAILSAAAALPVRAHQYVVRPVEIEIKVEPHRIRARIETHAAYWLYGILEVPALHAMPATQWPETHQKSSRDTVARSFQLNMDGRPLRLETFQCRFVQEPLSPSSARVIFEAVYPISSVGNRLSGRARFFWEAYQQHLKETVPDEEESLFLSRLRVVGDKKISLDLPIERPDFDISLDGMVMTEGQERMERLGRVALRVVSSPFFWIALIALAVQLYKRIFKRSEE